MLSRAVVLLLASLGLTGRGRAQDTLPLTSDLFETSNEGQLDSLYAPLVYIMQADEVGVYSTLSLGGKRDYLRRFWERRDPTPGTPRNEAAERFYRRVKSANTRFREGGAAAVPGWRTDRGRILIRYGQPDEVLSRPEPLGSLPYEVWKYGRGRRHKYCFVDLTRFGNYTLVYSDDLVEPSRPDWSELLGYEGYLDVMRF